MLKRILITAMLFFVLYNVLVSLYPCPHPNMFNPWHRNIDRAEQFVYHHSDSRMIIAGSSMAANLLENIISHDCFNLAMEGGSSRSGVELINASNKPPKILLIEINGILGNDDINMAEYIYKPGMFTLRKYLPALRQRNQPVYYAGSLAEVMMDKIRFMYLRQTKSVLSENNQPPAALVNQMMKDHLRDFNIIRDSSILRKGIQSFCEKLAEIKQKGCTVVFFEMPVDSSLMNAKRLSFVRKAAMEEGSKNGFVWIPVDTSHAYKAGDLIHLREEEAMRYSVYLRQKLHEPGLSE